MTNVAVVTVLADTAEERRSSPLLSLSADVRRTSVRKAADRRRAFPTPATSCSTPHRSPATPHGTPVPFPAHQTPRAIRVRRSPR
ncbi:hypothetical protein GCM10018780_41960 [Streptomyces lanatus]|nr:hypothetical protein GCM10018780_41960 [Streptomyces lanatus]